MDDDDLALRNLTYARFAGLGRAPTAADVAGAAGMREAQVRAGWERLHDAHALVLDPAGGIRMANPFSGVRPGTVSTPADGGGSATAPGMRSASAPPCTRTAGSRPSALTAASRCGSRCAISVPMTTACSSIVWSPPPAGGTTSFSLEPR